MTLLSTAPRPQAPWRTRARWSPHLSIAMLVASALAVAGAVLVVDVLRVPADEASVRAARLGLLLDGTSPGVSEFGLDQPPLLTLLALPPALFPALREHGLAGALGVAATSGLALFAAVGLVRWAGIERSAGALFVGAFAFHPLLLLSAAIGLPEMLYAALLAIAFHQFAVWLEADSAASIIASSAAMGVAFLVRYDSLWISAAMAATYWWIAGSGDEGDGAERATAVVATFLAPIVFSISLWAIFCAMVGGPAAISLGLAPATGIVPDLIRRDLTWEVVSGTGGWILRWGAVVGVPSAIAVSAVLVRAIHRQERAAVALAGVLASTGAAVAIPMITGHREQHVAALLPLAVPAFVAFAYLARASRTDATLPRAPRQLQRHQRRLLAVAAGLAAASLATVALLPMMQAGDWPAAELLLRAARRTPAAVSPDAGTTARWIADHEGTTYLVDPTRAAAVMLASGRFDAFRSFTPRDAGAQLDSLGGEAHLILRRPRDGWAAGAVIWPYGDRSPLPAPRLSLALDAGEYRIYEVKAPGDLARQ